MSDLHPQWTRRQTLWLLSGLVGSLTLPSCGQASQSASRANSAATVNAAMGITTWIGNSPLYIARGKRFFNEGGLNLDLQTFSTVSEAFPAFSAGQLQAVSPVTAEAVSLAAKGVDYRIVGVMDTSLGADGILARNSIADILDFKGKTVGVQKGGVGHFFLLQALAEAGLSEADISILDMAPDAAAAAYQTGNVEIVYSYSPFLEQADTAQPDGRIIFDTSKLPTAIADVYAFKTSFIEEQPDAVQAFLAGIFKALRVLNADSIEGLAIASQQLNIQPEELELQLKGIRLPDLKTNLDMLANPASDLYLLKPMNALAQFLKDQEQIAQVPDISNLIDPQFLLALKQPS